MFFKLNNALLVNIPFTNWPPGWMFKSGQDLRVLFAQVTEIKDTNIKNGHGVINDGI